MNLTLNQFEVLVYLERVQKSKQSQRKIAQEVSLSLGKVNQTLQELLDQNLLQYQEKGAYIVTEKGYASLEPYRVKKAIFLAAGFGSRMVPITLNTPKPLVLVKGKKIIETLLDAVVAAGIQDIYIVRGYLGEQFDCLLKKYPMIQFIDNPVYNETNNISSAYLIKDMMEQAYVFESDLYLYNPNIIRKYEYSSNYVGMKVERTDDWCFFTKKGIISGLAIGGEQCHHMYGISFWNSEDAKKMAKDVSAVYQQAGGKEKYWDEVALRVFKNHYKIRVREVQRGDIIEIDTFNELKQIDPIYAQ